MSDPAAGETATLDRHDHPCLIYETLDELAAACVPFMQAGLLLGERCVYVHNDTPAAWITTAMQVDGFDLQPYLDRGAFVVVHTGEAHMADGYFEQQKMLAYWREAVDAAREDGYTGLRASAEMTWATTGEPGCDGLVKYESTLNHFTEANPLTVVCSYRRQRFAPEVIKGIIHAHPMVIAGNQVLGNPNFVGPDVFDDGDVDLEVQAMLDNLALIRRLQDAREELDRAYDELLNVSYVISHELQEPITTFNSYQRLLAVRYRDRLDADADHFIEQCNRASRVMHKMVTDLWTYARIATPGMGFDEIDLTRAFGNALRELEDLIEAKGATITCGKLPTVYGIESQVSDVFRRLIENALQHGGNPRPAIAVAAQQLGDATWELQVSDDGRGIDPMSSKDAFKLFHRLDKRPTEDGSGMGLPICKKIVVHHGGEIWLDGRPDHGTVVRFTLPSRRTEHHERFSGRSDEVARK